MEDYIDFERQNQGTGYYICGICKEAVVDLCFDCGCCLNYSSDDEPCCMCEIISRDENV